MHVAGVTYELFMGNSHSLKAKRAVLRPVIDGIRSRFKLSVAEVGHQQTWQRATVAVAVVGASQARVEEILTTVDRFVRSAPDVEVIDIETAWLDGEGILAQEWWT